MYRLCTECIDLYHWYFAAYHLPVYCQITRLHNKPRPQHKTLLKRTITDESLHKFKQQFIDWYASCKSSGVNMVYDNFLSKFTHCYNHCSPFTGVNSISNSTDLPCITVALNKSIKNTHFKYKKVLRERNLNKMVVFIKYKSYGNKLTILRY